MPVQGSEPQRAVTLGIQLLQQAGLRKGRLLLVTDEDRPERITATARDLHQRGYELAVLGVGTTDGAPVPLPQGGFLKDNRGSLVLPKLEEPGLRRLAAEGGGAYRRLSIDDSDLQKLLEGLGTHRMDKAEAADGKTGQRWREEGVWLLWPLVLLGAFAFRRGWLLILALMLLQPLPARAFSWQDLWQRPDQQAADAFSAEQYEQAGKLFKDPRWRASALYRDGHYREAAETLKKPQSADDWYNRGNALAHSGQLSQALQAYNKALELQPEHADARYNLDLVQQALQQQQNRQQSDESSHAGQQAGKQPEKQQNDPSPSSRAAEDRGGQEGKASSEADSRESQQTPRDGHQADNTSAAGQKPQQKGQKTLQNRQKAAGRQDQAEAAPPRQTTSQNEGNPVPGADAEARTEEKSDNDRQQAVRHWLRRIPDDPGGLLRRKFLYQYRQRDRQLETDRPW
jgi:Ca-activated chloride channel family protein